MNAKSKTVNIAQLSNNEKNPREITHDDFEKLIDSIVTFPEMLKIRPMVVDGTMSVLGGNMRLRALNAIKQMDDVSLFDRCGKKRGITEAERDRLIKHWVEWKENPTVTVLDASELTEEQRKEFVIKDNVSFGNWDYDALANEWDAGLLSDWGVNVWNEENHDEDDENGKCDSDNNYERKIVPPVYEPQERDVKISDCYDTSKTEELMRRINESGIEDEGVRKFLEVAAMRHVVFDYEHIADYYARASSKVQRLMEDSALVIIDINKAIENGFVKLSKDLLKQQEYDERGIQE